MSLSCTFDIPTSARGPKRRKHLHSPPEVVETQNDHVSRSDHAPRPEVPASGPVDVRLEVRHLITHSSPVEQRSTLSVASSHSVKSPLANPTYATDALCPRELVLWMLDDYMRLLYPLIPVVHRPSFKRAISANQDSNDPDLCGLILSMCAAVVGTMPSRFQAYRSHKSPLAFETRQKFIEHAYTVLLDMRGPDWFDTISFNRFSTSYLFDIAFFQIGHVNRARMLEVECLQLGRMLDLHRITAYRGLNRIETQLRKKGFWLLFYSYVHSQVQSLRKERLTYLDPIMLQTIDLEALMPLDLDDEAIFEDGIVPELSSSPNLSKGFNITNLVFWAAVEPRPQSSTACQCTHTGDRRKQIAHLQSRLQDLKYALDSIPPELRPWAARPLPSASGTGPPTQPSDLLLTQLGAIRANLHVTHIWLQSILLDQLESLLQETPRAASTSTSTSPQDPSPSSSSSSFSHQAPAHLTTPSRRWSERESLCSQLIHVLHAIPPSSLEPNGLHLAFKVRDVAVGLLSCPFEPSEVESLRAAEFVREFTRLLSGLDSSESVATTNLKTWVDADRDRERGRGAGGGAGGGMGIARGGWEVEGEGEGGRDGEFGKAFGWM